MVQHCFADNASFNEKPHVEPKKSFSAKYVGCIDVPKPTGLTALFVVVVGLFVHCVGNVFQQYLCTQLRQKWHIKDEIFYMLQRNKMSSQITVRCSLQGSYDTVM